MVGLQVFFWDRGFQHALVISFGDPFGNEEAESVRRHADCERCAGEQGNVGSRGHHGHSELLSSGSHGDVGGSAPAHYYLSLHCSCCCPQISHSSVVAVAVVGDGAVVAFLETFPIVCPTLRWKIRTLHFLHHHWK